MRSIPISAMFLFKFLLYFSLLFLKRSYGFQGKEFAIRSNYHTFQISSLIPSAACTSSPTGHKKKASLRVIHRHGPCSILAQHKPNSPSHAQILAQDQSRVASIQSKLAKNSADGNSFKDSKATTIPAKSGETIGSGDYIVTVGVGTPERDLSFVFDTGSDLTWTQCQPCAKYCYKQHEPIFDPSMSASYTNISCNSPTCGQLKSATGVSPVCSSTTCIYGIQYGDQSYSVGFFAREKLTLTPTDKFDNFLFGCGQNNNGTFAGAAGLLGLGRDGLSILYQTAHKYGKVFSYCLPSTSSSTGYLTFGSTGGASKPLQFTSLVNLGTSFYSLEMEGISVGGTKLSIPKSVFSTAGTIIDSGTVISRLPPSAYSTLKTVFQEWMSNYPKAEALPLLDTCYDLSKYDIVIIPEISLIFNGAEMDLDVSGILYFLSSSQVCLAFAANSEATDVGIIGNVQQKTFDVVYDVAGGRVGFGEGGCN